MIKLSKEAKVFSGLCGGLLALILGFSSISTIPTGYVGIPVLFGRVQSGYLESGFHMLNPFSHVVKMDLRTQKEDEEGDIPSKEMLNMHVKTSINYHIDKSKAGDIYNTVGTDYINKIVEPHIRSTLREVTSGYFASQFFSESRDEIQNKIQAGLTHYLEPRGVIIESVMIKDVRPPQTVTNAIERKQAQQQEAEAMKYRLEREKLEAERKTIEAHGIQQFQEIVKQGIDSNLLAWKGIEATEALAKSPNSKIIVIGNKDTGLPLILGGDK